MDFSFSEEQTLLRNSVSKFLADNYNFETFKKISRTEPASLRERVSAEDVSVSDALRNSATSAKMAPIKNGMRHPQALSSASDSNS